VGSLVVMRMRVRQLEFVRRSTRTSGDLLVPGVEHAEEKTVGSPIPYLAGRRAAPYIPKWGDGEILQSRRGWNHGRVHWPTTIRGVSLDEVFRRCCPTWSC